eukprot:PITA_07428
MVRKSQSCVKIGGSTNSAFLALIPKEKGATDFGRFGPISLCNTSYKLITKSIANRLKNVLPDIIPENQGGFIKGRKILDNIVLVQEAVHSSCQRKEKGMVIKLDLANAFDRVRHDFLFVVMEKLGFSSTFINWVKACIAFPWIAPLVNGRSSKFFNASRGLRQGCPLSPLLYAIQASVLSFQLNCCQQIQSLPGIRMVPNVKDINDAQFADDTLLLGGASINFARSFKKELDIYKEVSGSKINYLKSTIYSWNCSVKDLADIARLLEMKGIQTWEFFKYLGIPIFKSIPKVAHWMPMLDKIKLRIQAWGATWLNNAGKVILMKSVLTSMPLYHHSILLAPKTFLSKLDSLLRRFLWEGGKNNEKRLHLVIWDTVKKPTLEGGLHLRDLGAQNLSLGSKILWSIVDGKTSWSKKVLWKKYFKGQRLRCLDQPPKTSKGSPIFKLCLSAMEHFSHNLYWIPGNGKNIRIWDDPILGDQSLNQVEGLKNIKIWLQSNNLNTLWDISTWTEDDGRWWATWNLGEVPQQLQVEATILLDKLQGKSPIKASAKGKRGWGSHSGKFTVAEGYKSRTMIPNVPPDPAQWRFIWAFPSLPKINFFCWTLAHNSILTRDTLRKRGMEGLSRCPLCMSEEESANHLLLLYPFARDVWRGVLRTGADKVEIPDLDSEEELWLKELVPHYDTKPLSLAIPHANWEIHLEEQMFIKWRSALEEHCLFFDGASKGNPGATGGGGVLLKPDGSTELRYHWGLGIESNNRAEALALWQGLNLALKRNILKLSVFGDSRLIIQALNLNTIPSQILLASIFKKIRLILPLFQKINFFHILRHLNDQADLEANLGSIRGRRSLLVNSDEDYCIIP